MKHVISVVSGKGGVGKTLVTAALGIALARTGKKVLLVDGDMGLRNLDLVLGIENDIFYTLWDLARGLCFPEDAVLPVKKNLDFLAASQADTWEHVSADAVYTVFEDLAGRYDYVLIDCPAGLGRGIEFAASVSQMAVLVIAPSWTSLRDAERTEQFLRRTCPVWVLYNNFSYGRKGSVSLEDLYDLGLAEEFLGVIPHSIEAEELAQQGMLASYSEQSVFGEALSLSVRALTEEKEYAFSKWENLLSRSVRENLDLEGKGRRPAGILNRSIHLAASWKRRGR